MRAIFYDVKPFGWAACQCIKRVWQPCLYTGLNGLTLREVAPGISAKDVQDQTEPLLRVASTLREMACL